MACKNLKFFEEKNKKKQSASFPYGLQECKILRGKNRENKFRIQESFYRGRIDEENKKRKAKVRI